MILGLKVLYFLKGRTAEKKVDAKCKAKRHRHFLYNPSSLYHFQSLNEISMNKIKLIDKRKK